MFKILKNGRTSSKTLFATYEQARQFLRKRLRKTTGFRDEGQPSNPGLQNGLFSYTSLGYNIRKVA
jgi:hypothetical protein